MHHQNNSILFILFVKDIESCHFKDSWIHQLILLPFRVLLLSLFILVLFTCLCLCSLLELGLHIFCLWSLVKLLSLKFRIISSVLLFIPLLLILFFCLLPAPSCILVIQIAIFNIFYFKHGLFKLRPWQNLRWLIFRPFRLFKYGVSSKDNGARTVRFLWRMRVFWFAVITRAWSRLIGIPKLGIDLAWWGILLIFLWFTSLRKISFHLQNYYKIKCY